MKKLLSLVMAIIVVCSFVFMALGSGSDAETSSNGTGTDASNTNAAAELPVYGVGESVSVKTSSGEYTVKITGVKETSERNEFSVSEMNMKVYDKDSNLLETYPATEEKYGSSVGTGRKSNGVAAYALNNENSYIEIDFYDNMFNSKADCRFKIEWK